MILSPKQRLEEIIRRKREYEEKLREKYDVPVHIWNVIEAKVAETVKINKDKLSGEDFRLGMLSMYLYLKNSNKLK